MKFLLIFSLLFGLLYASDSRYINGDYNENLKIIWMYSKADNTRDGLQTKFAKTLNPTLQKLQEKFENISSTTLQDYHSILSVIQDSDIYTQKEKLFDADMLGLLDNIESQLVVAFKMQKIGQDHYRLFGIKLFKDGDEHIVTTHEVNKHIKNITSKDIESMILFFVQSSIDDYESVQRVGSEPIITYADEKEEDLKIQIFKNQKIKKFTTYVASQDLELAASLGFLSSQENNQQTAQEYCELLGMMLINKNFVKSDESSEFYYELLFEKYSFKDGWEVYKRNNASDITGRNFKCIEAKDTTTQIPIKDYEVHEIGLKHKLNNAQEHKEKVVAVAIRSEESFDGSNTLYSAIADTTGLISIWENENMVTSIKSSNEDARSLALTSDLKEVTIANYSESRTYNIASKDTLTSNTNSLTEIYTIDKVTANTNTSATALINAKKELVINGTVTQLNYWPTSLAIAQNQMVIGSNASIYIYELDNDNQLLDTEPKVYSDFSGDVVKILYFKEDGYFLVATTDSELVFYKRGEESPIKIISSFGYSINDIAISESQKFLIVANGDQLVYIFDLDVILNSTVSKKDTK